MKRKILYFLFLMIPFYIFSNDGYYVYGAGGTLVPEVNKNISMEKELIEIDVAPKSVWETIADYKCTFWFKNNTNQRQSVLIGFPITKGHSTYSNGISEEGDLDSYDFKVTVDEKALKYKVFDESKTSDVPGLPVLNSQIYAFTVDFNPGETKKIVNTYRELHDTDGLGRNKSQFTYILQSGNTWEKPIGCADIIVKYHAPTGKLLNYYITSNPYLKNIEYSQKDPYTVIKFHAKDFKPETNVSFPAALFSFGLFYKATALLGYSAIAAERNNQEFIKGIEDIRNVGGIAYCDSTYINEAVKNLSPDSIESVKNSLLVASGYGGKTEAEKKYFDETYYSENPKCSYYISYYGESIRPVFFEDFDFNLELPCFKRIYENFNSAKFWQADLTQDCIWMTNKIKNEDSWYYAAIVYDQMINNRNREFPVNDKAILRKLLYECGNFYFDKGYDRMASSLYWKALEYTESYSKEAVETYHNDKYDTNFVKYSWKDEGKNNAPCYYIMYNALCCTCVYQLNELKNKKTTIPKIKDFLLTRFELVLHMGYPHYNYLRKDPDIALIRDNYPKEFEALIKKYENK